MFRIAHYNRRDMGHTAPSVERPLRADAARNRERVLAAARAGLAEHGLEVTVEDIAHRAGVGVGTIYRRFPTKEALVDAIVEARLHELRALAEAREQSSDAWAGFCAFFRRAAAVQAEDRGFTQAIVAAHEVGALPRAAIARRRLADAARRLVERAQAEGALRADLVTEDLPMLLCGVGQALPAVAEHAPDLWERHVGFLLDGLRAGAATPLARPPLDPELFDELVHGGEPGARPCAG